jgi:MarR-like DNA-binding transcriptional regulator SgrR of sgrS sRNA
VLTSEEESPISLKIKLMPKRRIRRVLRHSNIELYLFTGLRRYRDQLNRFFKEYGVKIKTIFLNSNQIENYLNNTDLKFLVMEKFFQKRIPIEHKIKTILNEMLFKRYDESYLRMVNELEEIGMLKNEELLMDHIAKIITRVVNEGIVLPLFQNRYSLYFKNNISGIQMDYYGRPLFQNLSKKTVSTNN